MKKIADILVPIINTIMLCIGFHIFGDKRLEFVIITTVLIAVNDAYIFSLHIIRRIRKHEKKRDNSDARGKTLEAVWVLKGYKCKSNCDLMNMPLQIEFTKEHTDTKKFDEMPSDNEIAQFIHDTKSDYVKLEHIFRLCECDIPFISRGGTR